MTEPVVFGVLKDNGHAETAIGSVKEHEMKLMEQTCDLCDDQGPLFLHAVCHMTAPLQVSIDGHTLIIRCYVPECHREVARFEIVRHLPSRAHSKVERSQEPGYGRPGSVRGE